MRNIEVGLLYLGLHNQLVKKYGRCGILSRKDFFTKLGKHGQIPKNLRQVVIKEMEQKKLIKVVNRDNIQILPVNIDLERDVGKLYKFSGVY